MRVSVPFHPAAHTPESHTGTDITAAELEELSDGSVDVALHTHIDNPPSATASQVELETAVLAYPRPDFIRRSPGVSKAWCRITAAGILEAPDYNVASVTDTGTGDRTIVWDDDFSTDVYAVSAALATDSAANPSVINHDTFAVGSVRHSIRHAESTNPLRDEGTSVSAFGDQN